MRNFLFIALSAAALLATTSCQAAPTKQAALRLAQNGKSNYVIALANDAIPAEKTAARELQNYLKKISGATLPIQRESTVAASRPQIIVGASTRAKQLAGTSLQKIGQDGIVIKTAGRNLVLAGDRPRGTLYAVYEFLEKTGGVRWWTKSESIVPRKTTLRVLPQDVVYTPPFAVREHYTTDVQKDGFFAARMRENGQFQPQGEELGGSVRILGFVHTFSQLLPPEKYFKAHPEWYSDPTNGNLPCTAASPMPDGVATQLNLTNDAMRAELTKVALEWIAKDPTAGIISISQNDNFNYCRSEGDLAINEREGSPAGSMLDFVNKVAADIEKQYPDFLVDTLAYQYTRKAPRTVRPRKNVIVRLCSIEADFARPLDNDSNKGFSDDMADWHKIAPRLFVWDYVTNFGKLIWPHPNLRVLAPNIRFFARHGVEGLFEQGDAYSNNVGEFAQLRTWILSKLMWDPQLDQTKLENEFLIGYYGAAAPHLRAYLDGMQDAFLKTGGRLSTGHTDFSYLTPQVVNASWQHFQAAQNAVKNNAVLSQRVRRERLVLDNVIITNYPETKRLAAQHPEQKYPALPTDIQAFIDDFIAVANANHARNTKEDYSENGNFSDYANALKNRYARPLTLPEILRIQLSPDAATRVIDAQETQFRFHMKGVLSDTVADPQASGGRAATIIGNTSEWALQYPIHDSPDFIAAKNWRIYVVARAEFAPDAPRDKPVFTAGVYNTATRETPLEKAVNLETLADGKYHLIDLGQTKLASDSFLWIAPSKRTDISKIFVDRVIFVRDK